MKHLDVLVGAGLVVSRRKGRVRWNHLNAVPLQRMYEHWVRPYEAVWAHSLIRFKDATEQSQERLMPALADRATAGIVTLEMEIPSTHHARKSGACSPGKFTAGGRVISTPRPTRRA